MIDYLRVKAASAGYDNVEAAVASAASLPLVDRAVSLVVSNYCYHHLSDRDKERALAEAYRVLAPGGRIVIADMMFRMQLADSRTRWVIGTKIKALLRRGPSGLLRLIKNAARLAARRWERPADPEWWRGALERAGFEQVDLQPLEHEGGIVVARRPDSAAARGHQRLAAVAQ
jgi:ubiquinone/menaquinone biosynthesis C-methylase UbiE